MYSIKGSFTLNRQFSHNGPRLCGGLGLSRSKRTLSDPALCQIICRVL